jgi:NADP-dependent 3-hydroxy acid dehydrogenase YdfG
MSRLEGKGALVIGAGNRDNMAQVIARRLHQEGARVVVAGRKAEELTRFAEEIGGTALLCDITDRAQVFALARTRGRRWARSTSR